MAAGGRPLESVALQDLGDDGELSLVGALERLVGAAGEAHANGRGKGTGGACGHSGGAALREAV